MKIKQVKDKRFPGNKVWKRKGRAIPKFEEFVYHFAMYSKYKFSIIVAKDIVAAGYYVADRDYLKEPNLPSEDDTVAYCWHSLCGGSSIMVIAPNANASTIAHESWHVAKAIMKFIGAEPENEFTAYLLGFLVEMVTDFQKLVAVKFRTPEGQTKSDKNQPVFKTRPRPRKRKAAVRSTRRVRTSKAAKSLRGSTL